MTSDAYMAGYDAGRADTEHQVSSATPTEYAESSDYARGYADGTGAAAWSAGFDAGKAETRAHMSLPGDPVVQGTEEYQRGYAAGKREEEDEETKAAARSEPGGTAVADPLGWEYVDRGYDDGWTGDVGKEFQDRHTDEKYQAGFAAGRRDRTSGHAYGTSKDAAKASPIEAPHVPYDGPTMETPGPTREHPYPEPPDFDPYPPHVPGEPEPYIPEPPPVMD